MNKQKVMKYILDMIGYIIVAFVKKTFVNSQKKTEVERSFCPLARRRLTSRSRRAIIALREGSSCSKGSRIAYYCRTSRCLLGHARKERSISRTDKGSSRSRWQ